MLPDAPCTRACPAASLQMASSAWMPWKLPLPGEHPAFPLLHSLPDPISHTNSPCSRLLLNNVDGVACGLARACSHATIVSLGLQSIKPPQQGGEEEETPIGESPENFVGAGGWGEAAAWRTGHASAAPAPADPLPAEGPASSAGDLPAARFGMGFTQGDLLKFQFGDDAPGGFDPYLLPAEGDVIIGADQMEDLLNSAVPTVPAVNQPPALPNSPPPPVPSPSPPPPKLESPPPPVPSPSPSPPPPKLESPPPPVSSPSPVQASTVQSPSPVVLQASPTAIPSPVSSPSPATPEPSLVPAPGPSADTPEPSAAPVPAPSSDGPTPPPSPSPSPAVPVPPTSAVPSPTAPKPYSPAGERLGLHGGKPATAVRLFGPEGEEPGPRTPELPSYREAAEAYGPDLPSYTAAAEAYGPDLPSYRAAAEAYGPDLPSYRAAAEAYGPDLPSYRAAAEAYGPELPSFRTTGDPYAPAELPASGRVPEGQLLSSLLGTLDPLGTPRSFRAKPQPYNRLPTNTQSTTTWFGRGGDCPQEWRIWDPSCPNVALGCPGGRRQDWVGTCELLALWEKGGAPTQCVHGRADVPSSCTPATPTCIRYAWVPSAL
jgi:hypothetical protein